MKIELKTKPWMHQRQELEKHWRDEARALFWQMRTGKSKVIIDIIGLWVKMQKVRSVIIIAPTGVHYNWVHVELPKHAWYEYIALAWSSYKANRKVYKTNIIKNLRSNTLSIFAFGKESILTPNAQSTIRFVLKRGPCALIVDESHHFGRPGAKQTRQLRNLAKHCVYRRILTGTPIGNSPLRLFSQFEILKPGCLGFTRYGDFENRYAVYSRRYIRNRNFTQVAGYRNLEDLKKRVDQHSSIILREECEDLPPILVSKQLYEPSPKQQKAYRDLVDKYTHETDEGAFISGVEVSTRLIRLQQVLSNFSVDGQNKVAIIDRASNPRIDVLCELIDGSTIVWCRFRECIRQVMIGLHKRKIVATEYHGGVTPKARKQAQTDFLTGKAQVFVGQPACAGEGLDLSKAETIIWYSHTFNIVQRDQANERATKKGAQSVAIIDLVVPNSIDEYILSNQQRKSEIGKAMTNEEFRYLLEKYSASKQRS